MKVEFLYFEGCPNHEIALAHLKESLSEVGIHTEIEIIDVENPDDAIKHRFLGSPSIRINNEDIEISEDDSTDYSMRCRRYKNGDNVEGFPSKNLIRKKLVADKEEKEC